MQDKVNLGDTCGFYGRQELKGEIADKVGRGAIEKNMELVVGGRFKKWGMSWSKPGAHYLLKLRLLKYDPEAWNEFWFTMNGIINHTASVDANQA